MRMIETAVVTSTNQATSPKFCIFGAGAIGGTIAAQLAGTNATVSVVARGDTLATIRKDGLRLLIDGETLHTSVQATAAHISLVVTSQKPSPPTTSATPNQPTVLPTAVSGPACVATNLCPMAAAFPRTAAVADRGCADH